eukprot:jgi/Bigna1/70503/fgenesh1_pg.12_\
MLTQSSNPKFHAIRGAGFLVAACSPKLQFDFLNPDFHLSRCVVRRGSQVLGKENVNPRPAQKRRTSAIANISREKMEELQRMMLQKQEESDEESSEDIVEVMEGQDEKACDKMLNPFVDTIQMKRNGMITTFGIDSKHSDQTEDEEKFDATNRSLSDVARDGNLGDVVEHVQTNMWRLQREEALNHTERKDIVETAVRCLQFSHAHMTLGQKGANQKCGSLNTTTIVEELLQTDIVGFDMEFLAGNFQELMVYLVQTLCFHDPENAPKCRNLVMFLIDEVGQSFDFACAVEEFENRRNNHVAFEDFFSGVPLDNQMPTDIEATRVCWSNDKDYEKVFPVKSRAMDAVMHQLALRKFKTDGQATCRQAEGIHKPCCTKMSPSVGNETCLEKRGSSEKSHLPIKQCVHNCPIPNLACQSVLNVKQQVEAIEQCTRRDTRLSTNTFLCDFEAKDADGRMTSYLCDAHGHGLCKGREQSWSSVANTGEGTELSASEFEAQRFTKSHHHSDFLDPHGCWFHQNGNGNFLHFMLRFQDTTSKGTEFERKCFPWSLDENQVKFQKKRCQKWLDLGFKASKKRQSTGKMLNYNPFLVELHEFCGLAMQISCKPRDMTKREVHTAHMGEAGSGETAVTELLALMGGPDSVVKIECDDTESTLSFDEQELRKDTVRAIVFDEAHKAGDEVRQMIHKFIGNGVASLNAKFQQLVCKNMGGFRVIVTMNGPMSEDMMSNIASADRRILPRAFARGAVKHDDVVAAQTSRHFHQSERSALSKPGWQSNHMIHTLRSPNNSHLSCTMAFFGADVVKNLKSQLDDIARQQWLLGRTVMKEFIDEGYLQICPHCIMPCTNLKTAYELFMQSRCRVGMKKQFRKLNEENFLLIQKLTGCGMFKCHPDAKMPEHTHLKGSNKLALVSGINMPAPDSSACRSLHAVCGEKNRNVNPIRMNAEDVHDAHVVGLRVSEKGLLSFKNKEFKNAESTCCSTTDLAHFAKFCAVVDGCVSIVDDEDFCCGKRCDFDEERASNPSMQTDHVMNVEETRNVRVIIGIANASTMWAENAKGEQKLWEQVKKLPKKFRMREFCGHPLKFSQEGTVLDRPLQTETVVVSETQMWDRFVHTGIPRKELANQTWQEVVARQILDKCAVFCSTEDHHGNKMISTRFVFHDTDDKSERKESARQKFFEGPVQAQLHQLSCVLCAQWWHRFKHQKGHNDEERATLRKFCAHESTRFKFSDTCLRKTNHSMTQSVLHAVMLTHFHCNHAC